MDRYKIIALMGESGAGKDTWQKFLAAHYEANKIVSCTTRPPRNYEKEGEDYYFLSNEQFAEKVMNMEMLEATSFNGWHYGTPLWSLKRDQLNIGVFNPAGIECLLEDMRLRVLPIWLKVEPKERIKRILLREENVDCSEMCRRYLADEKDFADIQFDYMSIKNDDYILRLSANEADQIARFFNLNK